MQALRKANHGDHNLIYFVRSAGLTSDSIDYNALATALYPLAAKAARRRAPPEMSDEEARLEEELRAEWNVHKEQMARQEEGRQGRQSEAQYTSSGREDFAPSMASWPRQRLEPAATPPATGGVPRGANPGNRITLPPAASPSSSHLGAAPTDDLGRYEARAPVTPSFSLELKAGTEAQTPTSLPLADTPGLVSRDSSSSALTPRSKLIQESINQSEQEGKKADDRIITERIMRVRRMSAASDGVRSREPSVCALSMQPLQQVQDRPSSASIAASDSGGREPSHSPCTTPERIRRMVEQGLPLHPGRDSRAGLEEPQGEVVPQRRHSGAVGAMAPDEAPAATAEDDGAGVAASSVAGSVTPATQGIKGQVYRA